MTAHLTTLDRLVIRSPFHGLRFIVFGARTVLVAGALESPKSAATSGGTTS
jgi:hypothetical protein